MISINIPISRIEEALLNGAKFTARPKQGMEFIAKRIIRDSLGSFYHKRDPVTGKPWPPWADSTRFHWHARSLMYRTGRLRSNIRVTRLTYANVDVTSRMPYSGVHQHGTKDRGKYIISAKNVKNIVYKGKNGVVKAPAVTHPGVPQRRFLGMSVKSMQLVREFFLERMSGRAT